ncbi:MAG: 1-hydroxycarotenoid 3,4-desaturase CrtD [Alphaproteobacteria bacterium]
MGSRRVVIVGAGVGGLAAAALLAARGLDVTICERAAAPGGKMRQVAIGDAQVDAGPTVLTMRWVFDEIFDDAGGSLDSAIRLHPADLLARHAWNADERLDLFADLDHSAEAIAAFSTGDDAQGFLAFAAAARDVYQTLENSYLRATDPSPMSLVRGAGVGGLGGLMGIKPFSRLWSVLGTYFKDPRLQQLFGRYATYCGSSPFDAPATLMLVAHVEQAGVWLPEGGMHGLARALAALAEKNGAACRYGAEVCETLVEQGRVCGVVLHTGERIDADVVIVNADAGALSAGLFGADAARAAPRLLPSERSLSAVTWKIVGRTEGFPLVHHSVFFSNDYPAEFRDIFGKGRLPQAPTVYICAQDRDDQGNLAVPGEERLFCLVNAPARADRNDPAPEDIERCEERTFDALERCGLIIHRAPEKTVMTAPADFNRLFPATGGALYGRATHGWRSAFQRPGARTKIPGLYLAGGGAHPGRVPMAALSGRLAAASILKDLASM